MHVMRASGTPKVVLAGLLLDKKVGHLTMNGADLKLRVTTATSQDGFLG